MNTDLLKSQLPDLLKGHFPSNARQIQFGLLNDLPSPCMLGIQLDPQPFDGKVVALTDEAIIVKTGRTRFVALDRNQVTRVPLVGSQVTVCPYARRRFDGQRADTPEEITRIDSQGNPYTVTSQVLGAAPVKLPVPKPQCPELAQLIEQLEQLPAPDGFRQIVHLLVDAGARDFSLVDPLPDDIFSTPPAICFSVSTAKFAGQVRVLYDRGADVYAVELHQGGTCVKRCDEVYFDDLGVVLEQWIDDGLWRRIALQEEVASKPVRKTALLHKAA